MRHWLRYSLPSVLTCAAAAQVGVLTYHNDLSRTGQNPAETLLTPANVNPARFGRLFNYTVDGYVYAQPLILPNVFIPRQGIHDLLIVATEHDSVYAFDAHVNSGAPLWQVSFLDPAVGATTVPFGEVACSQIVPEIGITATPVIDPQSNTLYVTAMTKESGKYAQRLHALDAATGAERPGSPALVEAPGFEPKNYKQRPGLLLLNGVVYTAWSSHCDIGAYHGWLIGYDAHTLKQVSVFNNTPNGNEGSFWASGAAPAADAAGNIYLVAGNGTFDADRGGPNLGESVIKLSTAAGVAVADYFAPFNTTSLNERDLDIGSSGALLLPDSAGSAAHPRLLTTAGKEGRIYLLDRDNLGGFQGGADSQIVQSLAGVIGPLFGIPVYFNNQVYFSGVNNAMKAFSIHDAALSETPASQTVSAFPYPGTVPSVSCNGTAGGIVWAIDPASHLRAFDAGDLSKELYHSGFSPRNDDPGPYVKFSTATVANGKVYVGAQQTVAVYGLLAADAPSIDSMANAAGFRAGDVAPGSIISVFGANLAVDVAQAAQAPLPVTLGGATLLINGLPAPLFYASPTQLNAQVPYEVSTGMANVTVVVGNSTSPAAPLRLRIAAPGIFLLEGGQAAAQNQDGSVNGAAHPAPAGSIVSVYLTGVGPTNPPVPTGAAAPSDPPALAMPPVTAMFDDQPADVLFSGLAPGLIGVFQVNLRVPAQLAPGAYTLLIESGGAFSNSAMVQVGPSG